jgi:glycosyltransferase involved in cell wall biosynthesis
MLEISVIIPAKDEQNNVGRCLDALMMQTLAQDKYEVILVDDGSTDGTTSTAQAYPVKLLRQSNRGPAAARNAGANLATGEILIFTDCDCALKPDFLQLMLQAFEDPRVAGAMGAYTSNAAEPVPRFVQQEFDFKQRRMAGAETIDTVHTYAAAYRRRIFAESGGFDEVYPVPSNEDQELSYRLAEAGHRLIFVPDAQVVHIHDRNLAEFVRRKFWLGFWKACTLLKHQQHLRGDSHTPPTQLAQIGLIPLIGIALIGWLFDPRAFIPALILGLTFLVTTAPFLRSVSRSDPGILWLAPLLILLRAIAQAAGLGLGFMIFILKNTSRKPSRLE